MAEAETTIKLELTPLVLTREQVGELLQVPADTVDNLHRTNQLRAFKIGKHLRWWPEHVCQFAERLAGNGREA